MNNLPPSFVAGASAVRQQAAPRLDKTGSREEIREAAIAFEAFFLAQFMENMFADIPTDGPFGGGFGEGIFRSFMLEEYGKSLANAGGIGIADAVMKEMISMQEIK